MSTQIYSLHGSTRINLSKFTHLFDTSTVVNYQTLKMSIENEIVLQQQKNIDDLLDSLTMNYDETFSLEIVNTVSMYLRRNPAVADIREYQELPGTSRKESTFPPRFKVYLPNGQVLINFDMILIPVNQDGDELPMCAIIISDVTIIDALVKTFEHIMQEISNKRLTKKDFIGHPARRMFDFFINRAGYKFQYFIDGTHTSLETVKFLMNDNIHIIKETPSCCI